jgi:hypothetical protein
MPGKRIPQLDAIAGASTANDDNLVIYDTDAGATKRILRSQLAAGLVGDLPYTPSGGIAATTVPAAIAELDSEAAKSAALAAAGGAALIGNTPAGTIAATTVQGAINELDTEKQPANAGLSDIAGLAKTDGNIIVGDGTNWVAEFGATARASLGLGDTGTPQFASIELGAATDTTISRVSAGVIAVEGSNVLLATDVGVSVQPYDADTAKTDTAQTFAAQQALTSGLVLQSVPAADIAAAANAINTTDKVAAKVIFDTTNNRLMVASGAGAVDPWYVADGSAFVTPA